MHRYYTIMICALALAAVSATADIVWSGEQNLSGRDQYIDLNSDSLVDVLIAYMTVTSFPETEFGGFLNAHIDGAGIDGSNRVLVDSSNNLDAALPYGTLISGTPDSSIKWKSGIFVSGLVSEWFSPPDTEWRGLLGENESTYVGISFDVGADTHYGWIHIGLGEEGPHGFPMPITKSWAYESTPGTSIAAGAIPEPSTGLLTMVGAVSLFYLRRARRNGRTWL